MSKVSDGEILALIQKSRETGTSLQELSGKFGAQIPRRTLPRRLSELVEAGEIEKRGKARATRYHFPKSINLIRTPPPGLLMEESVPFNAPAKKEESGPDYSKVAREIVNTVRAPQETRKSCSA